MRNRLVTLILALAFSLATLAPGRAQEPAQQPPPPPRTHLKVGAVAPDFTLPDHNRQPVTLSSFRGKKNVVLAFYVFAFTGG
jgi:cytochrome oxidase Cu insertion factor (SCO1/SenC/PrrC family)